VDLAFAGDAQTDGGIEHSNAPAAWHLLKSAIIAAGHDAR
jgi:hypothetical protein